MPRGVATKTRWASCEKAAFALGLTKSEVFNYMYDELVQAKLLELKDELAIAKAKELPGYALAIRARQIKMHEPEGSGSLVRELGMAIWFIRKAGGFEEARTLIDAAEAATKVIKRKEKEND